MVLDENRTKTLRRVVIISLIIILILILLMIRGCPACSRLIENRDNYKEDYPAPETIARSRALNTHDLNCMINLCTNDCAGNETGPIRMAECRKKCSAPEMIEQNSEKYPQCGK